MIQRECALIRMQPPVTDNRGLLYVSGATVPADNSDGYQTGCLFLHTDGGNNTALYVNEGSVTASDFNAVTTGGPADVLAIGEFASLISGSGIPLGSTQTSSIVAYGDDNGLSIASNVYNIRSRLLLTVDQVGASIRAFMGQLKLADGVDVQSGIYTAVQGYVELAGDHSTETGATFSCFDASVEIASGKVLTVDSGGEFAGIHVETTGAGTISNSGTCAGILIDKASGAASWPNGIQIVASDCLAGIAFTGTQDAGNDQKLIDFDNVTLADGSRNNIWSFGDTTAKTVVINDYFFPVRMNVTSSTDPVAGRRLAALMFLKFSVLTANQANLDLQGVGLTIDVGKNVGYAHAIDVGVIISASASTSSGTIIAGKHTLDIQSGATLTVDIGDNPSAVLGLIKGTGTYTGGAVVSCFEARKEGATTIDNGYWLTVSAGATVTYGLRFGGTGTITRVFKFDDLSCPVGSISTGHGGTLKTIECDIDGTAYYLILSTSPS